MHTLRVKKAKTFLESTIGLIRAPKPFPLLLRTRFGIHTFGVNFPIDVLILDDQHTVVRLKKNLTPNRIFLWPPKWQWVVELPEGTILKKKLHVGEQISLSFQQFNN